MTVLDLALIAWIVLWAAVGAARGMTEQVLSLAGVAVGALAGARLAPLVLADGRDSVWVPVVALAGAAIGATLVSTLLLGLARPLRRAVGVGPLRRVDQGGGLVVGGALGLALAWLVVAAALYQPGERLGDDVREQVRRSTIMRAVLAAAPPDAVLGALSRVDAFPVIPVPADALPDPDPSDVGAPGARAAGAGVVRVRGRACGVARQGSGWMLAPTLVATNAHVIAGQSETEVRAPGGETSAGRAVYVDARNDVALLRVSGLGARTLPLGDSPDRPAGVVLLGHPSGGPLRAEAGTAAPPRTVIADDAYGGGPGPRRVVVTRGNLGPGSSGGPVVDRAGEVVAMIFGGTPGEEAGAAVPAEEVRRGLRGPLDETVDTGPCIG